MSELENKTIVPENERKITEKDSVFNEVIKSQDTLKGDLKFDIPKFEETMTLLLKKYKLNEEVAKPVAETIAKVHYLEGIKAKVTKDMTYSAANNQINGLEEKAA